MLAWTGGGVTLLGVVLLLALAASRGFLTAPARLAIGAVLGAGLVGLAVVLHRRESARAGAFALAATGFAALYLTIAAATSLYDYLVPGVAVPLALAVAGAGLGVAHYWRSALLAGGVIGGAALLAPALAHGWLLVVLVLALQVAALPVVLRRAWPVLLILAAAGPALYGAGVVLTGGERDAVAITLAVAVLLVGLAATLAARPCRDGARAAVTAPAALPALAAASAVEPGGWAVALLAAVALGGVALLLPRLLPVPRAVRVAAGVAGLVALLAATVAGLDGAWVTAAVLGQALVAAGTATVLRSRFAAISGLVLGGLGFLAAIGRDAPPPVRFGTAPYLVDGIPQVAALVTGLAVALLLLATATVLLLATGRLGWTRPDAATAGVWVPLGLVGLYGAASVVVTAALLIAPTPAGFTAGHAAVTVSWTVAALVLLARGIDRPALRTAGLVLVTAAVAKLVLFDLVALDGIARVAAFLGAGLVLLAAGTRYARLVAEAEQGREQRPAG